MLKVYKFVVNSATEEGSYSEDYFVIEEAWEDAKEVLFEKHVKGKECIMSVSKGKVGSVYSSYGAGCEVKKGAIF